MTEVASPSPQRRVPVVLDPMPSETAGLSEDVSKELNNELTTQVESFKNTGKLASPRREVIKDETSTKPREDVLNIPNAPARVYYPRLRYLYELCGMFPPLEPADLKGLAILQIVAKKDDPTVLWEKETALQKAIRERVETQEAAFRERTQRGKQLLDEQKPKKSEYEEFIDHYQKAQDDIRLGTQTDQYVLADIDRRAEREQRLAEMREQERKELGEQRKKAAAEAREQRKAERERKLKELLDAEEDARDDVDAVKRVRSKFELEKQGKPVPK